MEKNLPYRTIGFSILGNILLAIVKIAAGYFRKFVCLGS